MSKERLLRDALPLVRVEGWRKSADLSIDDFLKPEKLNGLDRSHYWKMRCGERPFPDFYLERVAELSGWNLDYLKGVSDYKSEQDRIQYRLLSNTADSIGALCGYAAVLHYVSYEYEGSEQIAVICYTEYPGDYCSKDLGYYDEKNDRDWKFHIEHHGERYQLSSGDLAFGSYLSKSDREEFKALVKGEEKIVLLAPAVDGVLKGYSLEESCALLSRLVSGQVSFPGFELSHAAMGWLVDNVHQIHNEELRGVLING